MGGICLTSLTTWRISGFSLAPYIADKENGGDTAARSPLIRGECIEIIEIIEIEIQKKIIAFYITEALRYWIVLWWYQNESLTDNLKYGFLLGVIFFTTALITVFVSKIDFVRELAIIAFVMEYSISSITCIMEYVPMVPPHERGLVIFMITQTFVFSLMVASVLYLFIIRGVGKIRNLIKENKKKGSQPDGK